MFAGTVECRNNELFLDSVLKAEAVQLRYKNMKIQNRFIAEADLNIEYQWFLFEILLK